MDYLWTIIKEIDLNDIIDILIVAYIIYQIYRIIDFTRAIQLLRGIALIILVFFLSSIVQLRVVNFIIKNMITLGALALVVIFQPELRRGLEYLGRSQFGWFMFSDKGKKNQSDQIEEIIQATSILSNNKIGALMVFEGETGLKEIIETGTTIDAKVDSQLIRNIFVPKAPLHDGAIVIRGDRIEAAGCLLPLSGDRQVSKELGTRHRAALGMSNQSDALILVVSEETGIISIARHNNLERGIDIEELRNKLNEFYSPTNRKSFQEYLREMTNEENI